MARLLTQKQIILRDSNAFGDDPNTTYQSHYSRSSRHITKKMNKKAIEFAIKMGNWLVIVR